MDPQASTALWRLPPRLTPEHLELWLRELPADTERVRLQLGYRGCVGVPGTASHLQGALCLLQRKGIATEFAVPPLTFAEGRAEFAFAMPDIKQESALPNVTPAEKTLAYGVAGLILGQLCKPTPGDAAAR